MVAVGCAGVVGVWKLWECRSCRSEDSDVACDFAGKLKTRSAVASKRVTSSTGAAVIRLSI